MGIGGAAQNARKGGRRRAGGLSGEPEERRASRRLTRTLLTLRLQQHLPDVDRAKADALGYLKPLQTWVPETSFVKATVLTFTGMGFIWVVHL